MSFSSFRMHRKNVKKTNFTLSCFFDSQKKKKKNKEMKIKSLASRNLFSQLILRGIIQLSIAFFKIFKHFWLQNFNKRDWNLFCFDSVRDLTFNEHDSIFFYFSFQCNYW